MSEKITRSAIITGAGGNLGKACVEKFIAEGFRVIATVSPGKSLGYAMDGELYETSVDLTDETAAQNFVQTSGEKYGPIQAAALLVGGFAGGKLADTDAGSIRKMVTLNFETAYNVARPLVEVMKSQPHGGRIVLVGARPGLKATDGRHALAYSLSKGMIFHLAELLNAEAAKSNVVTHVVVPSTIDTPQNREAMPDSNFDDWVKPEEIANTIQYLCSDTGRPIRETVIKVYGNA